MGIINVTPDSFSDGGLFLDPHAAIDAGRRMIDEGADILDIGGESTRPGSAGISVDQELKRVMPVIEALAGEGLRISVDTMKPEVARQALAAGAEIVNDVTGFRDPAMSEVCAEAGCTVCLMHMQGEPRTMQADPRYDDVVREVASYLEAQASYAHNQGIQKDKIWIDPGIGFGKTLQHNLLLLKHLDQLVELGYPVLIGVSRKSFIGRIQGTQSPSDRLEGTMAAQVLAVAKGAQIVRCHDVQAAKRSLDVTFAILDA